MIAYSKLYARKGSSYNNPLPLPDPKNPQKRSSYYTLPIDSSTGRPAGNSRDWGDASPEVQKEAIDAIISASQRHGLSTRETAHILAIAYVESGFNPDAAAGTTTASSLGQLIKDTGKAYGIDNSNRFDISSNAEALTRLYLFNKKTSAKRGHIGRDGEERIYQYHHDGAGQYDGQAKDRGGLKLSQTRVLPIADNIEKVLNDTFTGIHIDPGRVPKKKNSYTKLVASTPKPRTDTKYIDPGAGSRLHPHAAETTAWHQQDYYNTKHWNISSRLYHLFHHDASSHGWTGSS